MWPYTEREWEFFDARRPRGELAVRTLAMPADTNPAGDIFGGWIMALMDSAGAITATKRAEGRVVTAAVSHIAFLRPVKVGDVVCCYTEIGHAGTTSITLNVEVWVLRQGRGARVKVTAAEFTFVALDDDGRPRRLAPGEGRGRDTAPPPLPMSTEGADIGSASDSVWA
jgi:acyl-CoA thioesterase YciA